MLKNIFFLSILSSQVVFAGTNEEIARGDYRGGRGDNRDYNRYENDNHIRRDGYDPAIYDGVLLNDPYNPDVQYTQPGITDDFNSVFEQNDQ